MCLSVGLPIALLAIFYKIIEIIISVNIFCGFFFDKKRYSILRSFFSCDFLVSLYIAWVLSLF